MCPCGQVREGGWGARFGLSLQEDKQYSLLRLTSTNVELVGVSDMMFLLCGIPISDYALRSLMVDWASKNLQSIKRLWTCV